MEQKNYLAFDIGGTNIKYGVINDQGKVIFNSLFPNRIRSHGVDAMLEDIVKYAKEMQAQYKLTAAGISTSGVIDITSGEVLRAADTFPGYKGKNPCKVITEATGLPCRADNDVNCAALGEYYFGSAIGKSSMCCVALGTGIGGATIVNGQLLYGVNYFAGEVAHFPVPGGEYEKVASTSALVRRVAALKNLPEEEVNGKKIFTWAKEGDQDCIATIDSVMETIALGLVYLLYAINPQVIVLGGAVAAQEEYLRPILMKHLSKMVLPDLLEATEIAFSKLDNTASILGAVAPYIKK